MSYAEERPNLGCLFAFGLFCAGMGIFNAMMSGFPYWVVQQVFTFAMAMGLVPFIHRVPIVRGMTDGTTRLAKFYGQHPKLLQPMALLARMLPLVNFYFMFRELRVMFLFILTGIPLDLALQAFTTYIVPLPVWGPARTMGFWGAFGMQALLTVTYTPYLVMLVLAFKWQRFAGHVPPPLPTTYDKRWR
jgi:hypothetical protein